MDEVNVAVMAPVLGRDLSFVSDVDSRVRVLDANFAAPRPGAPPATGTGELAVILAQAEVLLVGYPVPAVLAARSPRLAWAHHTQASRCATWSTGSADTEQPGRNELAAPCV